MTVLTMEERARRDAERQSEAVKRFSGEPLVHGEVAYFLTPARCGVKGCNGLAIELDCFAPFHQEHNVCRKHARGRAPSAGTAGKEGGHGV